MMVFRCAYHLFPLIYLTCVMAENNSTGPGSELSRKHGSERRLMRHLSDILSVESHFKTRPLQEEENPVLVTFNLTLVQILDLDEKNQMLTIQTWKNMRWSDSSLKWDPDEYGGIQAVNLDPGLFWKPDIILYNTYGEPKPDNELLNLRLFHDGGIIYLPPIIYKSSCQVDLSNFPFDTQTCALVFGPWTHNDEELDIVIDNTTALDTTQYIENTEWALVHWTVTKKSEVFDCCPGAFVIVTYILHLQRNAGYHVRVILLPVMLLSIMAVFIFCIPVHRPDRTGLGLSLFTGFMLLMLLVVGISPPSGDCALSTYLSCCIGIVSSAIIVSIVHLHMANWKTTVPSIIKTLLGSKIHRLFLPLTSSSSSPTDWPAVISFSDRIMFILYIVILVTCIMLYFPIPK